MPKAASSTSIRAPTGPVPSPELREEIVIGSAEGHPRGRPVVFGEVLFDVFDDGAEVLGGAPLNVAWHLQGFGRAPLMISARGDDARGEAIVDAFRRRGLDASGLQIDADHATGVVRARVDGADVDYEIVEDVAYDHVDVGRAREAVASERGACLIHGMLALRQESSRDAFLALRDAIAGPVFCDVNLRPPHTPLERVAEFVAAANWVKVNDEELSGLTQRVVGVPSDAAVAGEVLRARHDLDAVVVTLGADGAILVLRQGEPTFVPAPPLDDVVDPIGAGDAFASVAVIGLLEGWDATTILRRAHDFAASICGVRGAIPDDLEVYERVLARWDEDGHA